MTLVVVATTLVSDARSKIVSSVIGSAAGTSARFPIAFWYRIRSPRPDEYDRAGELLVRDRFLDERLDCVEPPDVDGHLTFGWPGRG